MISECGGSQSVYNRPNEGTLINHDTAYILLCELCSFQEEFETVYEAPLAFAEYYNITFIILIFSYC